MDRIFRPKFFPFLILPLIISVYSNTIDASWHFDDVLLLNNYFEIRDIPKLLTNLLSNPRSVGDLTFAINYAIDGNDVRGYHLVNIFLHSAVSISVYWMVILLFRTPSALGSPLAEKANYIASITALLFALHPVHTDAVTYVVQRYTVLLVLFYLLALMSYIMHLKGGKAKALFYAASIIFTLLAVFTKQNAFTIPITLLLIHLIFFRETFRAGKVFLRLTPLIITVSIIPLRILLTNVSELAVKESVYYISLSQTITTAETWQGFFAHFRALLYYFRYVLWPSGFSVAHTFTEVSSMLHPAVLSSYAIAFAILFIGNKARVRHPILSFGILFFLFAPLVELFWPDKYLFYDHWAYLPSIGLILSVVYCVFLLADRKVISLNIATGIFLSTALLLGTLTYLRNIDWKTEESLWRSAVKEEPENFNSLYNLGAALSRDGNTSEGCEYTKRAYKVDPYNPTVFFNLAGCYFKEGNLDMAEGFFKISAIKNPKNEIALFSYKNLAKIYFKKNDDEQAVWALKKYAAQYANTPKELNEVAKELILKRRFEKAEAILENNIALFAEDPEARDLLGVVFLNTNRVDEAEMQFNAALKLDPNHISSVINLGVVHEERGNDLEALELWVKVTEKDPDNVETLRRIATLMGRLGDEESVKNFTKLADEAVERIKKRRLR